MEKPWMKATSPGHAHRIAHSWWLTKLWTTHDCHDFVGAAIIEWYAQHEKKRIIQKAYAKARYCSTSAEAVTLQDFAQDLESEE